MKWMMQAYRGFDRNFKKNLKALYIVHPTNLILFMIKVFKPIIRSVLSQLFAVLVNDPFTKGELLPYLRKPSHFQ